MATPKDVKMMVDAYVTTWVKFKDAETKFWADEMRKRLDNHLMLVQEQSDVKQAMFKSLQKIDKKVTDNLHGKRDPQLFFETGMELQKIEDDFIPRLEKLGNEAEALPSRPSEAFLEYWNKHDKAAGKFLNELKTLDKDLSARAQQLENDLENVLMIRDKLDSVGMGLEMPMHYPIWNETPSSAPPGRAEGEVGAVSGGAGGVSGAVAGSAQPPQQQRSPPQQPPQQRQSPPQQQRSPPQQQQSPPQQQQSTFTPPQPVLQQQSPQPEPPAARPVSMEIKSPAPPTQSQFNGTGIAGGAGVGTPIASGGDDVTRLKRATSMPAQHVSPPVSPAVGLGSNLDATIAPLDQTGFQAMWGETKFVSKKAGKVSMEGLAAVDDAAIVAALSGSAVKLFASGQVEQQLKLYLFAQSKDGKTKFVSEIVVAKDQGTISCQHRSSTKGTVAGYAAEAAAALSFLKPQWEIGGPASPAIGKSPAAKAASQAI